MPLAAHPRVASASVSLSDCKTKSSDCVCCDCRHTFSKSFDSWHLICTSQLLLFASQSIRHTFYKVGQTVRPILWWLQADFLEELRQLAPDLCVTAAYGNILPQVMSDRLSLIFHTVFEYVATQHFKSARQHTSPLSDCLSASML